MVLIIFFLFSLQLAHNTAEELLQYIEMRWEPSGFSTCRVHYFVHEVYGRLGGVQTGG